jgi:hypothetical protein
MYNQAPNGEFWRREVRRARLKDTARLLLNAATFALALLVLVLMGTR